MTWSRQELVDKLRDVAAAAILQDEPFVVVAPQTTEIAAECIKTAEAGGFHVLSLGSGSSFPPHFSMLRDNVLAVLSLRLRGIHAVSPFTIQVLSGTPIEGLFRTIGSAERKTVGGLIADARPGISTNLLRELWPRIRFMDVLQESGKMRRYAGPVCASRRDLLSASLLMGSRGRLGMIASFEIIGTIPIAIEDEIERSSASAVFSGELALSAADARAEMDPHGLFHW